MEQTQQAQVFEPTTLSVGTPVLENPMDADAMRFLYDLGTRQRDCKIIEVGGQLYTNTSRDNPLTRIPKYEKPAPDMFTTYTLSGLVEFLKRDIDGFFSQYPFVHVAVENVDTVTVYSPVHGEKNERTKLATVTFSRPRIILNDYMGQEDFSVMVQSHFDQGENRDRVLAIAGNIRMEEEASLADDGVTQCVTIRSGIARKEDMQIVNPVYLAPHRTFPEIDQPSSPFILRVRKSEAQGVGIALFEADSCAWKVEAVGRIGEWLRDQLAEVPVVVIA